MWRSICSGTKRFSATAWPCRSVSVRGSCASSCEEMRQSCASSPWPVRSMDKPAPFCLQLLRFPMFRRARGAFCAGVDRACACRVVQPFEPRCLTQTALAEADELAGPSHERDLDDVSEAGSMVSGMSAYTTASTAAGSTVTGSGRPASTVGGRRPQNRNRKARQKVTFLRAHDHQSCAQWRRVCRHVLRLTLCVCGQLDCISRLQQLFCLMKETHLAVPWPVCQKTC